ncbi:MAG: hypothetical protein LH702_00695, partial [Phormidesmis sp. CAN_BIN44]|nr:hypothetical protein [Phormidesmis sp. CAN_BIN44]
FMIAPSINNDIKTKSKMRKKLDPAATDYFLIWLVSLLLFNVCNCWLDFDTTHRTRLITSIDSDL